MKDQLTKRRLNLLKILAGSLLIVYSSCTSSYVFVKELTSVSSSNSRVVLDISKDIELDTHTGRIIKDSLQRIDEIGQFLKNRENYTANIVVCYSNQLKRHVETSNLIGYNIEKMILSQEIQDKRISYNIEYDEDHTYAFHDKHQKILIYFKK